nr:uncharacterized protein LOC109183845 [Ipomoea batatas]
MPEEVATSLSHLHKTAQLGVVAASKCVNYDWGCTLDPLALTDKTPETSGSVVRKTRLLVTVDGMGSFADQFSGEYLDIGEGSQALVGFLKWLRKRVSTIGVRFCVGHQDTVALLRCALDFYGDDVHYLRRVVRSRKIEEIAHSIELFELQIVYLRMTSIADDGNRSYSQVWVPVSTLLCPSFGY